MADGIHGEFTLAVVGAESAVSEGSADIGSEVIAESGKGLPCQVGADAESADVAVLTVWWKGRCKSGRAGFATAVIPGNKKTTGRFPVS